MLGKVYLVGAGPGDPDLLTVKALRIIASAQVVVFDRLVSTEVIALLPPACRRIDVGKRASHHTLPQHRINDLLVDLARAGHQVVRLKGGDPFVFGRGGEEALALAVNSIPFEVVPGITSAQGCAAALKVPLTHRGLATGLRLITGHLMADGDLDLDWEGLADPATTLVVYMGLASIADIAGRLVAVGRDPATPVLAVTRATHATQRHLVATLATMAPAALAAGLESPTIFIIGDVVSLAAVLDAGRTFEIERLLDAAE